MENKQKTFKEATINRVYHPKAPSNMLQLDKVQDMLVHTDFILERARQTHNPNFTQY